VRDAFAAELVKLSPPELHTLDVRGAVYLRRLQLSPMTACPLLQTLNLSGCPALEYVLVQSQSLRTLELHKCPLLAKARETSAGH
jgi:hypothetical protein